MKTLIIALTIGLLAFAPVTGTVAADHTPGYWCESDDGGCAPLVESVDAVRHWECFLVGWQC